MMKVDLCRKLIFFSDGHVFDFDRSSVLQDLSQENIREMIMLQDLFFNLKLKP